MILITGAAGKTGRAIIQALTKRGEIVRALIHRPDQVPSLNALGVKDVIVGDARDQANLEHAVKNVRAIYHIAPNVSPDEVTIGKIIIAAAQSADVERFVFHSVLHPQVEAMPHHWLKARVEELLFASGLPFTILQPTAYMQNVLAHWDQILEHGKYPIPYSPETRLSLVDLEDVAEAAAQVANEMHGEINQSLRDAAGVHHRRRQDEEGNGGQRELVDGGEHFLGREHQAFGIEQGDAQHAGAADRDGDGDAEGKAQQHGD